MSYDGIKTVESIGVNGLTDPSSLQRINTLQEPRERAEAVATQMESFFHQQLIQAMRKTVPQNDLMGTSSAGVRQFQSMLDMQYAQMGGYPMDDLFHEALVNQIMESPGEAMRAVSLQSTPTVATETGQGVMKTANGEEGASNR